MTSDDQVVQEVKSDEYDDIEEEAEGHPGYITVEDGDGE